jgi:hypothetical protein
MSDVIPAFVRREEVEGGGNERQHLVEAPRARRAQERLQFGKCLFDRIEVRTVRREKSNSRSDGFDSDADLWLFMHRKVVEHDHVAGAERRDEHLVHVGVKADRINRPVEHGRRGDAFYPQGGDDGLRFPMTARRVIVQARAARTAAITAQQVGCDAALVNEDVPRRIVDRLDVPPLPTLRRDISAPLFVGVYRFFCG